MKIKKALEECGFRKEAIINGVVFYATNGFVIGLSEERVEELNNDQCYVLSVRQNQLPSAGDTPSSRFVASIRKSMGEPDMSIIQNGLIYYIYVKGAQA